MLLLLMLLAAPERVAVLPTDVEAGTEVPKLIDDYILTAVQKQGYEAIGSSDVNALLSFEKQKQLVGCDDTTCLAEIGGALGVERLVTFKVARVENSWATSASLIFIAGEPRVESRITEFVEGGTEDLLKAVPRIIYHLFGAMEPEDVPAERAPLPDEPLEEEYFDPEPVDADEEEEPSPSGIVVGTALSVTRPLTSDEAVGFGGLVNWGYLFEGLTAEGVAGYLVIPRGGKRYGALPAMVGVRYDWGFPGTSTALAWKARAGFAMVHGLDNDDPSGQEFVAGGGMGVVINYSDETRFGVMLEYWHLGESTIVTSMGVDWLM